MQLHSGSYSIPWHTGGENSDLSMQWSQLSRYCSTDRSSSIGSMESLDPSSQGYYDRQLSPVDPTIFSNKRDSAYSSFSASSNTSDYTVSLRPDESSSTDNLLRSLGSCRYSDGRCQDSESDTGPCQEELNRKAHSLSRRPDAKARPSSYTCEEERVTSGNARSPPEPPVRRDSFRVTRGHQGASDQRHISAPIVVSGVSNFWVEDPVKSQDRPAAAYPIELEKGKACQGNCNLEQYCPLTPQLEPCHDFSRAAPSGNGTASRLPEQLLPAHSYTPAESSDRSVKENVKLPFGLPQAPKRKGNMGSHRHSAPEQLLSTHLRVMTLSNNPAEVSSLYPDCMWARPSLHPEDESGTVAGGNVVSQEKWTGSRCSTPGSMGASEAEAEALQPALVLLPTQQRGGSSHSVCGEAEAEHLQAPESMTEEDTCVVPYAAGHTADSGQEIQDGGERDEAVRSASSLCSARQRRSSQSRRRSERFATNLRNEIQRKKAQLLKGTDPSCLLHGEQTLEEEKWGEQPSPSPSSLPSTQLSTAPPLEPVELSTSTTKGLHSVCGYLLGTEPKSQTKHCQVQVVEEPAPAGKPRRWRWMTQQRVQPETEALLQGSTTVVFAQSDANVVTKCPSCIKPESAEIPPFADRRRFFEETSRSTSVSNLTGFQLRREVQWRKPDKAKAEASGHKTEPNQRRYSYQGEGNHDVRKYGQRETGRQNVLRCYRKEQERGYTSPNTQCGGDGVSSAEVLEVKPYPSPSEARRSCGRLGGTRLGSRVDPQEKSERRSKTPVEAHPVKMLAKTKLNRNFSLTERDLLRCRQHLQPVEAAVPPHYQSHWDVSCVTEKRRVCNWKDPAAHYSQRGRALSESNILDDSEQLPTLAATAQLCAADKPEKSDSEPKKKGSPPPRPPPPNWLKFYGRATSHQNLFCRPCSPGRELLCPSEPLKPSCDLDVARHRSRSLPLRQGLESREEPSPVSCDLGAPQRCFRPAAPVTCEHPRTVTCTWLPSSENVPNTGQAGGALWKAVPQSAPYTSQQTPGVCGMEKDSARTQISYESLCTVSGEPCEKSSGVGTEPRSAPVRAEAGEVGARPLETDIDTLLGEVGVASEEPACPACLGAVLETDIDMPPGVGLPHTPALKPCHDPAVELFLGETPCTELVGELLPHSGGGDMRREGRSALELSVDTLKRRAKQTSVSPRGPDSQSASYSNTSAGKAQPPYKMNEPSGLNEDEENHELSYKKQQLMERLQTKLGVLREAQQGLQEDIQANIQLGEEVEALVLAVCKPSEVDKFRMVVGDLDKVVNLLLSLSARLLRVETTLEGLSPDCEHQERLHLLEKRQQLVTQLREAQELKEHVDRREQAVCQVLGRCLAPEQLHNYGHFVRMKAALLVEQRQLEDKIRLGEEQLRGLRESLGLGVVTHLGQDSALY